jgi:hypothetical protein
LSPHLLPGAYFLSCGCSYPDRDGFLCRAVDALKLTVIGHARGGGFVDSIADVSVRPTPAAGTRDTDHG